MSFSLRTLFAVVLFAAIFAAVLLYRTPVLFLFLVVLVLGILSVGTAGILFGGLPKHSWIPFCLVGWLYLAVAFTPLASTRLVLYLPSTRLSYVVWRNYTVKAPSPPSPQGFLGNTLSVQNGELSIDFSTSNSPALMSGGFVGSGWVYLRVFDGFSDLLRIMHLLGAVLMASMAGVVTSFLLRHKSEPG